MIVSAIDRVVVEQASGASGRLGMAWPPQSQTKWVSKIQKEIENLSLGGKRSALQQKDLDFGDFPKMPNAV